MLVPIQPKHVIDREDLCLAPWLLPLIEAANRGDSIIHPLQDIVRSMGFGSFLYGVGTSQKLQHDEKFYLWSTVPPEWIAEYDRNSYVEIDPRVNYGWATWPPPLMWDRSIGNRDPRVATFLERAAVFGVGSGLAIYLRDGGNKIMFALNRPQRVLRAKDRAQIASITSQAMYLGAVLHSVFMSNVISRGVPPIHHGSPLSARERQCLQLAARGMTSFDIGLKLAITERTANFHFSNIISKMGVLNRLEAIAMGVAHGLIQVDPSAAPLKPLRASKIRDAQLKRWEALRENEQQPRSDSPFGNAMPESVGRPRSERSTSS